MSKPFAEHSSVFKTLWAWHEAARKLSFPPEELYICPQEGKWFFVILHGDAIVSAELDISGMSDKEFLDGWEAYVNDLTGFSHADLLVTYDAWLKGWSVPLVTALMDKGMVKTENGTMVPS